MTLNDAILAATGGPTVNDGLLSYYKANGATSDNLNDAEYEFLKGQPNVTADQVNDMWFEFLAAYPGTLNDKKLAYWSGVEEGGPRIVGAEVRGDRPWKIIVFYSEDVLSGTGNYAPGFTVEVNGQFRSVVGGQGSNIGVFETYVDVDPIIEAGDTITISYDSGVGAIISRDNGEPVASVNNFPVQNIVPPGANPTLWYQLNQGLELEPGNKVEGWNSQVGDSKLSGGVSGAEDFPTLEAGGVIFFPPNLKTGFRELTNTFSNSDYTHYQLLETPSEEWPFRGNQAMVDGAGNSMTQGIDYRWAEDPKTFSIWCDNTRGENEIPYPPGTWAVVMGRFAGGGQAELRVNDDPGVLQPNIASRGSLFSPSVFRGGQTADSQPWANGRIKEMLTYTSAHDTPTQDQVIAYLLALQAGSINDFVTYSGVQLFSGPTPVYLGV